MPTDELLTGQVPEPNEDDFIARRNAWLEERLNPEGRLPTTQIVLLDGNMQRCQGHLPANPPFDGNSGSIYLNLPGDPNPIADLVFGQEPSIPNMLIVTDASVRDDYRNRGYGIRLYLEALKALPAHYGLISHANLSPVDGVGMWERLVRVGVARVRTTPVKGQVGKYETAFKM